MNKAADDIGQILIGKMQSMIAAGDVCIKFEMTDDSKARQEELERTGFAELPRATITATFLMSSLLSPIAPYGIS